MAIKYVDLASGNDTTGDGSWATPYLTMAKVVTVGADGDECRVKATSAHTSLVANFTFTNNSKTITHDGATLGFTGGEIIGKPSATGNGNIESFYRVASYSYAGSTGTITLKGEYYGTTEVVASVNKVNPITTGPTNNDVVNLTKLLYVSGGWDTASTQNGETWLVPGYPRTSATWVFNATGNGLNSTIKNINAVNGGRFYLGNGEVGYCTVVGFYSSNSEIQACYNLHDYTSTNHENGGNSSGVINLYPTLTVATNPVSIYKTPYYHNVRVIGMAAISGSNFNGFWVFGTANSYGKLFLDGTVKALNISTCNGFGGGVYVHHKGLYCERCTGNTAGLLMYGSQSKVEDSDFLYCGQGIACTTNTWIDNCRFTGCTSISGAVSAGGAGSQALIENSTFTNNNYDIGSIYVSGTPGIARNNTHVNPTTWSYYIANALTWQITNCTTDTPAKFLLDKTADANTAIPYAVVEGCPALPDGAYYTQHYLVLDTTNLDEDGKPTLKYKNEGTYTWNTWYETLKSYWVKGGIAKTFEFRYKSFSGDFTGTIIPALYLNGKVIKTGTSITTIANASGWYTATISVTANEVTEDGELEFKLNYNGNSTATNWGKFSLT